MKIKKILLLYILLFIFLTFGLIMIYSASNIQSSFKYNDAHYYFKKELIFTIIALVFLSLCSFINLSKIHKLANTLMIISVITLILVIFIGVSKGGAKSWINLGLFSFQPSEITKLTFIIFLAKVLSIEDYKVKNFKHFMLNLAYGLTLFFLIMLQPDFGTGIVIMLSLLITLFLANAPFKYFILIMVIGMIGIIVLILSAPYRINRITAFLDPFNDPLGSGFQAIQSLYAIIPSGIFGVGFNKSIQKHFFLPEPQNDFIFAIICEELGLFGGLFVIILFFILIITIYHVGIMSFNLTNRYLCFGIASTMFTQVFINIGVVIGLLPITGITLPFISYGGTSLITSTLMIGLVIKVCKEELIS